MAKALKAIPGFSQVATKKQANKLATTHPKLPFRTKAVTKHSAYENYQLTLYKNSRFGENYQKGHMS